jgi:hypothetical protein
LGEHMKTTYDTFITCFSAYFHKLSKIDYENNLFIIQNSLTLFYTVC